MSQGGQERSHLYKAPYTTIDSSLFFTKIMQNSTFAAIFILDMEGTILDMSVGVRTSFGYLKGDIVGKNFAMLFIPRDRKSKMPEIELTTVLQKGSANDENYIVHRDGSYIWSKGESVLTYGPGGEIYIVKFIYEINQQKLMEKHLVAVQDVYEGVLDTFPDPVIILDTSLRITDVNRAFCQVFDFVSVDEVYAQPLFELKNKMWNISALKSSVKNVLRTEGEEDIIIEYVFEGLGKKMFTVIIHLVQVGYMDKRICIVMKEI